MNELVSHAVSLSAAATGALVSAVWQGALLAVLVFLVLRMFPRLSAAARSVIWLNVFMLLALLHVLPAFAGAGAAAHAYARGMGLHAVRLDPRWSLAVAAVWVILSVVRLCQLALGAIHLRRIARRATPIAAAPALEPLLLHNGHAVRLCASDDVARPSVLGFFRPRILVPPPLVEELSEEELQQVVLHEMEHLRRGDDWINLLQKLALVLFPLNPALAWVERRLCAERELACDDRVLHAGPGRKAYALCLTHLAEFALVKRSFSLVLGAWERRPELVRRVHRILAGPVRSMGRRPALAAMGSVTVGALACTLALARAPQVVRFAPAAHVQQRADVAGAAMDVQEMGRELGGKPEMVKAILPPPAPRDPQPVRRAAVQRALHKTAPPARLAELRTAPAPQPPAMIVMTTAWSDDAVRTEVIVSFAQAESNPRVTELRGDRSAQNQTRALRAVTAFAVVPTMDGWLVIQI